jgi:hypothetical protein
MGHGADASISRFAESEPNAWRVVFLLLLWPRGSSSIPNAPSCTSTSKWHQDHRLLIYCPHIIHPLDLTRSADPALSWFPTVQEPSSTLCGTVCTIPKLDFDLPAILVYFHCPYHSPNTAGGRNGNFAKPGLCPTAHAIVLHRNPKLCTSLFSSTSIWYGVSPSGRIYEDKDDINFIHCALTQEEMRSKLLSLLEAADTQHLGEIARQGIKRKHRIERRSNICSWRKML